MHKSKKRRISRVIALILVAVIIIALLATVLLIGYGNVMRMGGTIVLGYDGGGEIIGGEVIVEDELSIHFLELGNRYSGDSIYIKAGDVDILVDGGSRESSANTIDAYLKQHVTDNTLEYLIVTHADQDHIAALAGNGTHAGIFDRYDITNIIDFPRTDKNTQIYNRYVEKRSAEIAQGANHYTALQCYNETDGAQRTIELTDNISIEILYQKFYEQKSSDENNYSVCFQIDHSGRKFLFTGDLEEAGEKSLAENNNWDQPVELFKGGHHGSGTSSTAVLLAKIQPKIVCICCCAGSSEYTSNTANQFPTQAMIDRVALYTDMVYVTTLCIDYSSSKFTSMNGNIAVTSDADGVGVVGSNNTTKLKDTEWFVANRTMPQAWASQ